MRLSASHRLVSLVGCVLENCFVLLARHQARLLVQAIVDRMAIAVCLLLSIHTSKLTDLSVGEGTDSLTSSPLCSDPVVSSSWKGPCRRFTMTGGRARDCDIPGGDEHPHGTCQNAARFFTTDGG